MNPKARAKAKERANNHCEECGKYYEYLNPHHVVFGKGQRKTCETEYSLKYLDDECHLGTKGPHKNKKKDLEYKIELQAKYKEILTQPYYTQQEIKKELELTGEQAKRIFKTLPLHSEGYKTEDIIMRLMGGRLYE